MKFLIQTIDNKMIHDFSFTLIEAIRYRKWFKFKGIEIDQDRYALSEMAQWVFRSGIRRTV